MVSAINRKLLRDIRSLKGQVITICLVVTAGITVFVAVQSTYASIHTSKDAYYGAYHFADVFATAQRIPNSVQQRLRTIPDVALSYPHIAQQGRLLLTGDMHAADAHFLSLPDYGTPPLNDVHLVEGRMPNANRGDEALVLEAFARAHGVRPGDTLSAVIDGTLRYLSITGLAMSPEYVQGFALRPAKGLCRPVAAQGGLGAVGGHGGGRGHSTSLRCACSCHFLPLRGSRCISCCPPHHYPAPGGGHAPAGTPGLQADFCLPPTFFWAFGAHGAAGLSPAAFPPSHFYHGHCLCNCHYVAGPQFFL